MLNPCKKIVKMNMTLEKFFRIPLNLTYKFTIFLAMVVGTVLLVSFYIVNIHQEKLLIKQIENEAKTIAQQIIVLRKWIADHGGILVKKLPEEKPNPYLYKVGLTPEVKDLQGKIFLLRNPALVTRELSEYAEKMVSYRFRIVSLNPINPDNAPNSIEKKALQLFETSRQDSYSEIADFSGEKYFVYVYPLRTEQACLQCHIKQGYKIGDVRGAISVILPVDKIFKEVYANKEKLLFIMFFTIGSLIIAVIFLVGIYISRPLYWFRKSIKDFKEGKIPPKQALNTGDEFEEIYKTFIEMVNEINIYHQSLHERIKEATKELEEANRQLLELNTKKSDFIASAAHELRTPLTSIKGAVDYLLQTFKENQDSEIIIQFLDIIKRNSERLIRMVKNMLDLERIEAGIMEFQYHNFNLRELIEDTVVEFIQNEKNIRFTVKVSQDLCLYADADKIQQVICNLLINAIKFSPGNSEITIRGWQKDDSIWVEVEDMGEGILGEEKEKIFEKFYKGKNSTGTGLGLAISKAIVESHKGGIGVKNLERGSCFYFWLPRNKNG
ncbi:MULTISPECIES: DUF3365 domain-containing protein [Thermodesulfovibrio]|uniref:ATP-binding protein n=1 Tax=Thermodesulfovibrio TaxID=28261 RepID=UPI00040710AD|nr:MULTISPECIES: DUF3365 domain-containing protein [Thermodesulfovibrio]MDI6865213.1 DUF3365 domain-containing protein [Thermodesulfovibrio yellowstonii]